ncbi:MAG: hypothetical protein JWN54_1391 [Mycobacterium sp.]|nr:hypothetical protein [Mycobacterium sp.]
MSSATWAAASPGRARSTNPPDECPGYTRPPGYAADVTEQPETRFQVEIGPDVEVGVYANFVSIWHDAETFTLDFAAVTRPPFPVQDAETGEEYTQVPTRIVSRVKVPPSQVFEIMRALNTQLAAWEQETGRERPGGLGGDAFEG